MNPDVTAEFHPGRNLVYKMTQKWCPTFGCLLLQTLICGITCSMHHQPSQQRPILFCSYALAFKNHMQMLLRQELGQDIVPTSKSSMGTFVGHFFPGFALALLGLWHIINTARAFFLNSPNSFKSRFSYPLKISYFQFQNLDLILILSFCILAIVTQVLDFPVIRLASRLDNFEHATMFLHLLLFSGFALLSELTQTSDSLSGVTGMLAISVFGQELFLLHFHSTDHIGIEGQYHWLLQLIVLVSFLSAIAVTLWPTSFPASVVLAVSVVFQGLWFVNMGFMLWVPELVPQGCTLTSVQAIQHGDVTVVCGSEDADSRARALANLQFSWILSAVLVFTGSLCLKLASSKGSTGRRSVDYQKLQSSIGGDLYQTVSIDGFKLDHSPGL